MNEAVKITRKNMADELKGQPLQKMHCSNLGADALHAAIKDYWVKIEKIKPKEAEGEERDEGKA